MNRLRGKLWIAGVLVLALFLTACGSKPAPSQQPSTQPSASPASPTPVTITFWHPYPEAYVQVFEQIAKDFTAKNPHITVKVTRVPAGDVTDVQKLMAAVSAGTGPDIYFLDRFTVAQRAEAGMLEDISPLIARDKFDMNQFLSFGVKECTWRAKTWCVPVNTDTRMLYYNKDHFKEVGLDPEKPPKTIDEVDAYHEKLLKREGNKIVRYGILPWTYAGAPYSWGWAFGAKFFDEGSNKIMLDDPAIIKSLEWQAKYAKLTNNVMDPFGDAAAMGTTGGPFMTGHQSMIIGGSWVLDDIKRYKPNMNFGIAPIPTASGVQGPITWAGGWAMTIPKGAKNAAAAWEFTKYFSTTGQETWLKAFPNNMPVVKKLLDTHPMKGDKYFKEFLAVLPVAKIRPPLPIGALVWDELGAIRGKVVTGQGNPLELVKNAQTKVQAELDKIMKK